MATKFFGRANLRAYLSTTALVAAAMLGSAGAVQAQAPGSVINGDRSLSGTLNCEGGRGYFVQSGTLNFSNGQIVNCRTVGGAGSGGGAGLGGAIFVNNGASVVLNGVNFFGNTAVGGAGGIGTVGGSLNDGALLGGSGLSGANGVTVQDSEYLLGAGNGNGLPGTGGGNGADGLLGSGGTGGTGGPARPVGVQTHFCNRT